MGGTLRTPSLDPLTISVGRNYTQAPGGTLALGVAGVNGRDYDHLQVGGNASLDGILAVSSLNNFRPGRGNVFEVLHSNGTRNGQFAQVKDFLNNNPNLQRIDVYAPNGVAFLYVAAAQPAPGPALIPPPIEAVIPNPLPPVDSEKPISPSFLLRVLNPTAEQLTSLFQIPFSGANTQRFNLDNRFAEIQRGSTGFASPLPTVPTTAKETVFQKDGKTVPPAPVLQPGPQNRWGVWVNGWGDFVSVEDDNFAKGYHFTTGGGSVGIDYRITDSLAVGVFAGYAHTWTDLNPGEVDVNTGRGGLYASYWNKGFYINGAVYGGYNSYDTSRQQLIRGMANGSTSGYEFSTFGEAGYDFHFENFSVGPIGSLQYTNVHVDGYSERGSFLPLNIQSDSEESLRTDLGIQASYTWQIGKVLVIPILRAAWEHEYLYSALPITFSAVAFPGATATAFGPDEGHDSFIINAGAATQWTPRISTFVGYQGQLGRSNYEANGVSGSISFAF
jgi:fibronectin-binding autotransporter adhesin